MNVVVAHQVTLALTAVAERYTELAPDAGLAEQFLDEVDGLLRVLGEQPLAGQRVDSLHRRMLLRRFPYVLYYRVHDGTLFVDRLLAQAQARPY